MLENTFIKQENLIAKKIGNECIIVPVVNDIVDMDSLYTLNEVGSFIWDNIDGSRKVEEIISSVITEFNIDKVTATNDVTQLMAELEKEVLCKMIN